MPKSSKGLIKRGEIYHISKTIKGKQIRESTGTGDLEEAERYLAKRIQELYEETHFGLSRQRTFVEAATKYLEEENKESLWRDADSLKLLVPFIGELPMKKVHMDSLQQFISSRQRGGTKNVTINRDLAVVRRILNLAHRQWIDEQGNSWLSRFPLIRMLPDDSAPPMTINKEEEIRLLNELPEHLAIMAKFALNTGCRDREITGLRWSELKEDFGGFVLPAERSKSSRPRYIPLNTTARMVVNSQRRKHPTFVFTYKDRPIERMSGKAWRNARARAMLPNFRVHDLRHTFASRLRALGIGFQDQQDLLGHKSRRITDHYSSGDVEHLLSCVEELDSANLHKFNTLRAVS